MATGAVKFVQSSDEGTTVVFQYRDLAFHFFHALFTEQNGVLFCGDGGVHSRSLPLFAGLFQLLCSCLPLLPISIYLKAELFLKKRRLFVVIFLPFRLHFSAAWQHEGKGGHILFTLECQVTVMDISNLLGYRQP